MRRVVAITLTLLLITTNLATISDTSFNALRTYPSNLAPSLVFKPIEKEKTQYRAIVAGEMALDLWLPAMDKVRDIDLAALPEDIVEAFKKFVNFKVRLDPAANGPTVKPYFNQTKVLEMGGKKSSRIFYFPMRVTIGDEPEILTAIFSTERNEDGHFRRVVCTQEQFEDIAARMDASNLTAPLKAAWPWTKPGDELIDPFSKKALDYYAAALPDAERITEYTNDIDAASWYRICYARLFGKNDHEFVLDFFTWLGVAGRLTARDLRSEVLDNEYFVKLYFAALLLDEGSAAKAKDREVNFFNLYFMVMFADAPNREDLIRRYFKIESVGTAFTNCAKKMFPYYMKTGQFREAVVVARNMKDLCLNLGMFHKDKLEKLTADAEAWSKLIHDAEVGLHSGELAENIAAGRFEGRKMRELFTGARAVYEFKFIEAVRRAVPAEALAADMKEDSRVEPAGPSLLKALEAFAAKEAAAIAAGIKKSGLPLRGIDRRIALEYFGDLFYDRYGMRPRHLFDAAADPDSDAGKRVSAFFDRVLDLNADIGVRVLCEQASVRRHIFNRIRPFVSPAGPVTLHEMMKAYDKNRSDGAVPSPITGLEGIKAVMAALKSQGLLKGPEPVKEGDAITPEVIYAGILGEMMGRDLSREESFETTRRILAIQHPALGERLEKMRGLINEESFDKIADAINGDFTLGMERRIISLAFFTPGNGGGLDETTDLESRVNKLWPFKSPGGEFAPFRHITGEAGGALVRRNDEKERTLGICGEIVAAAADAKEFSAGIDASVWVKILYARFFTSKDPATILDFCAWLKSLGERHTAFRRAILRDRTFLNLYFVARYMDNESMRECVDNKEHPFTRFSYRSYFYDNHMDVEDLPVAEENREMGRTVNDCVWDIIYEFEKGLKYAAAADLVGHVRQTYAIHARKNREEGPGSGDVEFRLGYLEQKYRRSGRLLELTDAISRYIRDMAPGPSEWGAVLKSTSGRLDLYISGAYGRFAADNFTLLPAAGELAPPPEGPATEHDIKFDDFLRSEALAVVSGATMTEAKERGLLPDREDPELKEYLHDLFVRYYGMEPADLFGSGFFDMLHAAISRNEAQRRDTGAKPLAAAMRQAIDVLPREYKDYGAIDYRNFAAAIEEATDGAFKLTGEELDKEPLFIFTKMVAFDNGLLPYLGRVAHGRIKVAVIYKTDDELKAIQELNIGRSREQQVIAVRAASDISTTLRNPKGSKCYYFRMEGEQESPGIGDVSVFDLRVENVKRIIKALGRICAKAIDEAGELFAKAVEQAA